MAWSKKRTVLWGCGGYGLVSHNAKMNLPKKHIKETKKLLQQIPPEEVGEWLLKDGYFPEQYVVPPCFNVETAALNAAPYYPRTAESPHFNPPHFELKKVSFPKTQLTDRTFGVFHPTINHDLIWYLKEDWQAIIDHLFQSANKIYSYSFPIPLNSRNLGNVGSLRAGRMIYEFIEMAENDLVVEAHKYKYILNTDIKNFYPSIYTHSIPWALHGKTAARSDRNTFLQLGNKLDRLTQRGNDGCTNGLPIGPAISDLIAEIILTGVDVDTSKILKQKGIEFLAVRFKDDYRILCNSKTDANTIIKIIQKTLAEYNLTLNENKSNIKELPEGLFRLWTSEYSNFTLRYYKEKIYYKRFERTLLAVLKIDQEFPGTGVIDKFLSELTTKDYNLKLQLKSKEILKTISLLLLLKEKRTKALPMILAIIEVIYIKYGTTVKVKTQIVDSIKDIFEIMITDQEKNLYELLWLSYFIKSHNLFTIVWPRRIKSKLLKSIKANSQQFFSHPDFKLYTTIKSHGRNELLLKHLAIFPKDDE